MAYVCLHISVTSPSISKTALQNGVGIKRVSASLKQCNYKLSYMVQIIPNTTNTSFFLNACCVLVFCVRVCFYTGIFVMVPLNLTCLHCLRHSFFEHLFDLYYRYAFK